MYYLYNIINLKYKKMRKITLFIVLTIGIATQLVSQTDYSDTLSINNIKALVRAGGVQFWEPNQNNQFDTSNRSVYEFPKNSGKNTIFCSSLWFAGKDINNNIRIAAETYNENGTDFWTGPLSNDGSASTNQFNVNNWNKVWGINKQDLINYLNSSSYPSNPPPFVLNWPVYGDTTQNQSFLLAPFVDIDNNGIYQPYLGDYPKIFGDQCYFFIINDKKIHNESHGQALGLEIHVFAYAFYNLNDTSLNNTIFYKYKIFNKSINTYTDCYIGFYNDFDIGYSFDDYLGCDVELSTCYAYNGNLYDGDGQNHSYGVNPPVQGMTILKGAKMNTDALDNPKLDINGNQICDYSVNGRYFGDSYIDNERFGMCNFVHLDNSTGTYGSPEYPIDFFNILSNNLLKWGIYHYDTSSNYVNARFAFPGLTDSTNWGTDCGNRPFPNNWNEALSNNPPGDRRGVSSMGPFAFHPNGIQEIDICYTTTSSISSLNQTISHIQNLMLLSPEIFQGYVGINNNKLINNLLKIYPNPAFKELCIEGITIKNCKYEVYNLIGQICKSGNIYNEIIQKIDISQLQKGVYLIKFYNSDFST